MAKRSPYSIRFFRGRDYRIIPFLYTVSRDPDVDYENFNVEFNQRFQYLSYASNNLGIRETVASGGLTSVALSGGDTLIDITFRNTFDDTKLVPIVYFKGVQIPFDLSWYNDIDGAAGTVQLLNNRNLTSIVDADWTVDFGDFLPFVVTDFRPSIDVSNREFEWLGSRKSKIKVALKQDYTLDPYFDSTLRYGSGYEKLRNIVFDSVGNARTVGFALVGAGLNPEEIPTDSERGLSLHVLKFRGCLLDEFDVGISDTGISMSFNFLGFSESFVRRSTASFVEHMDHGGDLITPE